MPWLSVDDTRQSQLEDSDSGSVGLCTISHPDMRVKHCACDHSVATLLNPQSVATVSHKYSLTIALAVPSTVHYPANYKIKIYYLR
jgi:hypothetical protein